MHNMGGKGKALMWEISKHNNEGWEHKFQGCFGCMPMRIIK
jgi:hypothetical protein